MLPYVLLSIKSVLLLWGVMGLWEYISPAAGFGLQNPKFPEGTQLLHWLLLVLTGASFVLGYMFRWRHTPFVSITMYAALATLCFIETLDFGAFGGGPERFYIMAGEYLLYISLGVYLTRSRRIGERFGRRA
jgi:hypothetical protein